MTWPLRAPGQAPHHLARLPAFGHKSQSLLLGLLPALALGEGLVSWTGTVVTFTVTPGTETSASCFCQHQSVAQSLQPRSAAQQLSSSCQSFPGAKGMAVALLSDLGVWALPLTSWVTLGSLLNS